MALVDVLRGGPIEGKLCLICTRPHQAWARSPSHHGYSNIVARICGNVLRRFLDAAPFRLREHA